MNLFWVHIDPKQAVEMLADTHVSSTMREGMQMFGTALRQHVGLEEPAELVLWQGEPALVPRPLEEEVAGGVQLIARSTHEQHPMTKWVAHHEKAMHLCLLWVEAACNEHEYRFGMRPVTMLRLRLVADLYLGYRPRLPAGDFREPPRCVPEQYRAGTLPEAYRAYYRAEKRHLLKYTGRTIPRWLR
jgi:hypothetical protein